MRCAEKLQEEEFLSDSGTGQNVCGVQRSYKRRNSLEILVRDKLIEVCREAARGGLPQRFWYRRKFVGVQRSCKRRKFQRIWYRTNCLKHAEKLQEEEFLRDSSMRQIE